jgi:hypothetical protein
LQKIYNMKIDKNKIIKISKPIPPELKQAIENKMNKIEKIQSQKIDHSKNNI